MMKPFLQTSMTCLLLATLARVDCYAQLSGSNTIATPHPLDPATNSTNPSATATQSQNPYLGSVRVMPLQPGVLKLSLEDAVRYALRANLGLIDSTEERESARAEDLKALSELLPHLESNASQHYVRADSSSTGGRKIGLPGLIGPYSYESMNLVLSDSLLDLQSIYHLRGSRHESEAAAFTEKDSRNIVVLAAASAYIAISASQSREKSDQAALELAQALETLMKDRVERGVSPKIEWIRAQVAARTAQQRLDLAGIQLQKDRFALERVIGLSVDQELELTSPLSYRDIPKDGAQNVIDKAEMNRGDLKSAEEYKQAAAESVSSAKARRLPEVSIHASYGAAGVTPAHLYNNYEVSGTLRLPLFTGGEIRSEIRKAQQQSVRRQSEYEDLQERVRYDVHSALLDLQAAEHSVNVATQNLDLAKEGLKEAQDRFDVGLSNSLDLVQSQQELAEARDNYISSLYAHNLARLMLIRATGTAEKDLPLYIGEK